MKWIMVYVCVFCGFVNSGRRYSVKEGVIRELKPFSHESEWLNQYNWVLESAANQPEIAADALLIGHLLQESRRRETWSWNDLEIPDHEIGSYSMVQITENSMFYIGKAGDVQERFYLASNKFKTFRHGGPVYEAIYSQDGAIDIAEHPVDPTLGPIVSLTSVTSDGYVGVIACDESGRVLQRQMLTEGLVGWVDISFKGHPIIAGGVLSHPEYSTHSAFFVTRDGLLAEIDFHTKKWTIHQEPSELKLGIVIDPAAGLPTAKPSFVFCITKTGSLVSYDISTKKWNIIWTGRKEPRTVLLQRPVTVLDSNNVLFATNNGVGQLRYNTIQKEYYWILDIPPAEFSFATAPCAAYKKAFAISKRHSLVSYDTKNWSLQTSPLNGVEIAHIRPLFMPSRNKIIIQSTDGDLVDYDLI